MMNVTRRLSVSLKATGSAPRRGASAHIANSSCWTDGNQSPPPPALPLILPPPKRSQLRTLCSCNNWSIASIPVVATSSLLFCVIKVQFCGFKPTGMIQIWLLYRQGTGPPCLGLGKGFINLHPKGISMLRNINWIFIRF
jgi:hypothetical protein